MHGGITGSAVRPELHNQEFLMHNDGIGLHLFNEHMPLYAAHCDT